MLVALRREARAMDTQQPERPIGRSSEEHEERLVGIRACRIRVWLTDPGGGESSAAQVGASIAAARKGNTYRMIRLLPVGSPRKMVVEKDTSALASDEKDRRCRTTDQCDARNFPFLGSRPQ
jgi:hypothetical protein